MGDGWRERALSPDEAVRLVADGHRIFLHGGCAVSFPLEAALAERAEHLDGLTVYQLHKEGVETIAARELVGHARIYSWFCGAGIREAVAEGRAEYVPVFLSDIPHYLREGIFPLDVAVVQVSAPDSHGYCSLGVSLDVARQAVRSADVVLAEVNARMPRTHGDTFLHLDEITAFIATDRPLAEHLPTSLTPETQTLGRHVAALVEDGATLQIGIGGVAEGILASLFGKHDLGIHTEMFSDGVVDLVRAGVVTGRRKTLHEGVIVTSFVVGTRKVFDFVDDNPSVEFHPSDYTNDTSVIRRHERMTAVNGALQVDLTGQVVADSIGGRIYSGIGGQMDFVRGASLAPGGKAIIALPSTAKGGSVSRIAPVIDPGAGVVTTRGHVQYVVTEYGAADLRGKSLRERGEALAEIAHPDFRAELRAHLRRPSVSLPGGASSSPRIEAGASKTPVPA